jgi:hypothetical protein
MSEIDILRKAGFSDGEITEYLSRGGFEQEEIAKELGAPPGGTRPTSTITNKPVPSFDEALSQNRKVAGAAAPIAGDIAGPFLAPQIKGPQMGIKLLNLLNKALADEWLAYYQYWIGAKVVKGPMKDAVIVSVS